MLVIVCANMPVGTGFGFHAQDCINRGCDQVGDQRAQALRFQAFERICIKLVAVVVVNTLVGLAAPLRLIANLFEPLLKLANTERTLVGLGFILRTGVHILAVDTLLIEQISTNNNIFHIYARQLSRKGLNCVVSNFLA